MDKYQRFLHENTKGIDSVCELGAGLFKNFPFYSCATKIGIELVPSYIENIQVPRNCITQIINGNALEFESLLGDTQVDAFACIDFIEHLEKDVAINLIERMKQRGRRILIFTPGGTCHQDGHATWSFCLPGLNLRMQKDRELAIEAQRHKSTWYKEDFEALGFTVDEDHTFMGTPAPFHDIGEDGGSVLWAVWNK